MRNEREMKERERNERERNEREREMKERERVNFIDLRDLDPEYSS